MKPKTVVIRLGLVLFVGGLCYFLRFQGGYIDVSSYPPVDPSRISRIQSPYIASANGGPLGNLNASMFNLDYALDGLDNDVTIVTAYFNIGRFQKGESYFSQYTPNLYHKWMRIFEKIRNPLIVYVDKMEDANYFFALRQDMPANRTKIILATKENMWAFKLRDKIAQIFSNPAYPKHHPNTVIPDYTCAMHAKYECMLSAVRDNPFRTKYFSWLDIGLFRDILTVDQVDFSLGLPPQFDSSKVAYGQVFRTLNLNVTPQDVFYKNMVWVCGCYFVSKVDVMAKWVSDYMRATEHFLAQGLASTDQQVILAMHRDNHFPRAVNVQAYTNTHGHSPYFHLGYLCKDQGTTRA